MHTPSNKTMHAPSNKIMHDPPVQPCMPPMDKIVDTRFWKYYLALTSLRAVNIDLAIVLDIKAVMNTAKIINYVIIIE